MPAGIFGRYPRSERGGAANPTFYLIVHDRIAPGVLKRWLQAAAIRSAQRQMLAGDSRSESEALACPAATVANMQIEPLVPSGLENRLM